MIRTRMSKNGQKSYQVIVRIKGYPEMVKTHRTKREAENWEIKIKASMKDGTFRDMRPGETKTLSDAIDRFLQDPLKRDKKNFKTIKGHVVWWKERLGKYALLRISPDLIGKCRDELRSGITVRKQQRTPATVNRYLDSLSSVFKIVVKEWRWVQENPVKEVRKLKEPQGRTRFLSDEERYRLLEECLNSKNPHLYPLVILALSTAMRRGEVSNLNWSNVDLESGRAILHKTKNGERRVVYLRGQALRVLKEHTSTYGLQSLLPFPSRDDKKSTAFETAWKNARDRAGIKDFRFHDLRHSSASYLAMNGATPSEIAEILGHKTLNMVKRYAHLSESHTKNVVESMNDKIFGSS